MGGTNGKEKRSRQSKGNLNEIGAGSGGDRMKDDYVQFIMREQLRRDKEFKEKTNDKDNIYNQVT